MVPGDRLSAHTCRAEVGFTAAPGSSTLLLSTTVDVASPHPPSLSSHPSSPQAPNHRAEEGYPKTQLPMVPDPGKST